MNRVLLNLFFNAAVIHTAFDTFACVDAKEQTENTTKLRQRMLKSPKAPKSPKSAKPKIVKDFCPVETVTAEVYDVQGSTEVFSGTTAQGAYLTATSDCDESTVGYGEDYADCMSSSPDNGVYFYYPLFPRNNDGSSATSQFVSAATDASPAGAGGASPGSLNDSYFKGDINCSESSCKGNKVDIQWWDYSLNEVFNVSIADIEYIQYDFFPLTCPNESPCYEQFYLGVYTHRATGGGDWYDCRLNFIPIEGAVGDWNTFTINSDTLSSTYERKGACPDGSGGLITTGTGQKTGVAAFEDAPEFLLGAAGEPDRDDYPLIFAFNMGDTEPNDNGLVGYFDNIRVKIKNKPLIIYDL